MKILLYGATGTIADSFFDIIKENKKKYKVAAATCNTNYSKLEKLKRVYGIKKIGINDHESAEKYIANYGTYSCKK